MEGKTLLVHAGMRKTASSTLQQMFHRNSDILLDHGILYPKLATSSYNHRRLGKEIAAKDTSILPNYVEQLQNEMAQSPCHTVLLSYEGWSHSEDAAKFFKELASLLKVRLSALLIVRKPEDYVNSWYAHQIANFATSSSFPEFFENQLRTDHLRYLSALDRWQKTADAELIAVPLNGSSKIESAVLERLGIFESRIRFVNTSNEAKSAYEIEVFRRINQRKKIKSILSFPNMRKQSKEIIGRNCSTEISSKNAFYGVTDDMAHKVKVCLEKDLDKFSEAVWDKQWSEVFPNAFKPTKSLSVIEPEKLSDFERTEFDAVVRKSERDIRILHQAHKSAEQDA